MNGGLIQLLKWNMGDVLNLRCTNRSLQPFLLRPAARPKPEFVHYFKPDSYFKKYKSNYRIMLLYLLLRNRI